MSHQQALLLLQQPGDTVELVVARDNPSGASSPRVQADLSTMVRSPEKPGGGGLGSLTGGGAASIGGPGRGGPGERDLGYRTGGRGLGSCPGEGGTGVGGSFGRSPVSPGLPTPEVQVKEVQE